ESGKLVSGYIDDNIQTFQKNIAEGFIDVEWKNGNFSRVRYGKNGKADLKCKYLIESNNVYYEHLPKLQMTNTIHHQSALFLTVNQKVLINRNYRIISHLMSMQKPTKLCYIRNQSEKYIKTAKFISGQFGKIKSVENEYAIVTIELDDTEYKIPFSCFNQYKEPKLNDRVKIFNDRELIHMCYNMHVEDNIIKITNNIGIVSKINTEIIEVTFPQYDGIKLLFPKFLVIVQRGWKEMYATLIYKLPLYLDLKNYVINSIDSITKTFILPLCGYSSDVETMKKNIHKFEKNFMYGTYCYSVMHFVSINPNNASIIHYLIKEGYNVDPRSRYYETPLHLACYLGNEEIIKVLIEHKADINAVNIFGFTPLHIAANMGFLSCFNELISHGALIYLQDIYGDTVIHDIVAFSELTMVDNILCIENINLNIINNNGFTPLFNAIFYRNGAFLQHGPKHDSKAVHNIVKLFSETMDRHVLEDWNVFHFAAYIGFTDIISSMALNTNSNYINKRNFEGDTPLHHAIKYGTSQCIIELLKYGANITINDANENNSVALAIMHIRPCKEDNNEIIYNIIKKLKISISKFKVTKGNIVLILYLLLLGASFESLINGDMTVLQKFRIYYKNALTNEVKRKIEEDLESRKRCMICLDTRRLVRMMPCTHIIACKDDSLKIKECLVCHQNIQTKLVVSNNEIIRNEPIKTQYKALEISKNIDGDMEELKDRIDELEYTITCLICLDNQRDIVFNCGHTVCKSCSIKLEECHICRKKIKSKNSLYF
ncbi:hypothetical protein A3Q56_04182, partial [Intoshia linei]